MRTKAIFEWVFGLPRMASPSASASCRCSTGWAQWLGLAGDADESGGQGPYRLGFLGVSDEGISMAADRRKREESSLTSLRQVLLRPQPSILNLNP